MGSLSPVQLLAELENLVAAPPPDLLAETDLRAKLYQASKRAALALEQPTEVAVRLLLAHPVESTIVNIALRLELFSKLADAEYPPLSLASLVESTGADVELLKRILSVVAAFGAVKVGAGSYTHSPSYKTLADPAFGNANPMDPKNTAVQRAFGMADAYLIGILLQKRAAGQAFGRLMSTWGEVNALLQHLYPVENLVEGFDAEISKVMFVDVGSGYGQKAIALKQEFPELLGRIAVQDPAMSIEQAPTVPGIESQAHDFFTEQPINHAKVYYIRQCLHNWPDDACIQFLRHLGDALKPGYSKLLIYKQVMPERGASEWSPYRM
ncbi:S-adenosyl-L-methionine-dependent methyltransferase [Lentithecium fluviatile CBS 122367]|uniref:S-adenosyl-L-methionine-dependent methyltransferase n=1 Tax=Lentithecium fluviatile CBS 122367 TaxID=1168545 RepID=A0A6G1ICK8_9PLEO|nr:S-adenosyl-L-methionine-dependent methyltransferase [Lentithecium fluviatile CBS 122367]